MDICRIKPRRAICRNNEIIDKLEKIGRENVVKCLQDLKVADEKIQKILNFIEIDGTTDEKLQKLENLNFTNELFLQGLNELKEVVKYVRLFGVPDSNFKVDLTIARGDRLLHRYSIRNIFR